MPEYLVKPDPEEDLYVNWSTVIDAPISWGPAEFMDLDPERKERADRRGTSSYDGYFDWKHENLIVSEVGHGKGQYLLPRKHLLAFITELSDVIEDKDGEQAVLEKYATKIAHTTEG